MNDGHDLLFRSGKHELWWREMAGYAFRLRRRSYGGRLGFNPPCPVAVTPPLVGALNVMVGVDV